MFIGISGVPVFGVKCTHVGSPHPPRESRLERVFLPYTQAPQTTPAVLEVMVAQVDYYIRANHSINGKENYG